MAVLVRMFRVFVLIALVALAVTIVAAAISRTSVPSTAISSPTAATQGPTGALATPTSCSARGVLPDPVCTPGAADPRVTQATIGSTICVSGYTTTVRPPATYTNALKIDQMKAYGFTGAPSDYEEDHLIPLEVGGDPRDPRNLWPEPRRSIGGRAEDKDTVENALHADVCAGRISLAEAQRRIATDWTTAR